MSAFKQNIGLQAFRQKGFTIVEVLVSMAVIVTITSVVLVSYSKFGDNILLSNLAYDMALTVRQAQSYGISVREFGEGVPTFDAGYGVRFASDNSKGYVLFADASDDNKCTGTTVLECAGGDELVKSFEIKRANQISKICVAPPGASVVWQCYDFKDGGRRDIKHLDVVFNRPDPDAKITTDVGTDYQYAEVCVISSGGVEKALRVAVTGQLSVQGICGI